jgi:hypothetical protein
MADEVKPKCACESHPGTGRKDPRHEPGIKVLSSAFHTGWGSIEVECGRCGQRWSVVEDMGYHFPTYTWEKVGRG